MTEEEGLAICDIRLLYSDFKTSTPVKENICSSDNLECWDGTCKEPSSDACPPMPRFRRFFDDDGRVEQVPVNFEAKDRGWSVENEDRSVTPSQQPSDMEDSDLEREMDFSYGGQWAGRQRMETPPPPLPSSPPPYLDFGISVFDQTNSQVLSNSFMGRSEGLNCDELEVETMLRKSDSIKPKGNNSDELEVETMLKVKRSLRREDKIDNDTKDILERKVLHMKTKKELGEEIKSKVNPNDFRTEELRVMVTNVRGFFSKKESLEAILAREKIDVACICETFMSGNRFPQLQGFSTFFRNRSSRGSGGVAVMIREEKAKYAVKVHSGSGDNEFLVIKWTNCQPNLVMVVYYGQQSQVFGVDNIKMHISEMLEVVKKQIRLGCHVNLVGDFNLRIGDRVKGNHPDSSVTGRLFLDQIDALGLEILNSRSKNPVTFIDKSKPTHTRLVLDLVISNQPDAVTQFKTDDEDFNFTPYSVRMRKGKSSRVHADHMSIIYQVSTAWSDRVEFTREPMWYYKKMLGDVKYDLFTSNACRLLVQKVEEEEDINKVHAAFMKVIKKAKFVSYGKRSVTASKIKRIDDDLVWRQRIADLDKLQKMFQDEKETNQIYKTRKSVLRGQQENQNVVIEVEDSEEVLEDLDDVLDHILTYNVKNMEKVKPAEQTERIMEQKAKVVDMMLEDGEIEQFPAVIPWEIYLKVMTKIHRQKKACFRDVIKSGRNFKYALYRLLNRMFAQEEFPDVSFITRLTKIWKRKGSQARLKNNRFIHGKEPISKIWEKCIVEMIAMELDRATPQLQAGSRKGRSTRDQLMKVIVMQKYFECKSKPLPILLVDVQSCFDKMVLSDVIFDTLESGANPRAVRALRKFSDTTVIKLKGDMRNNGEGEGRTIKNTLGQGSNYAPPGIGLTTSKSLWQQFEGAEGIMAMIGEVVADPQSYVDDIATLPMDEVGLVEACQRISVALENISLRTHPDKTEVVVSGRNKKAEEMRLNLTNNPARMQGNPVKVSDSGMYLGMRVSQQGHKDTVDLTVRHRVAKSWGRVADVKAVINDARMSRLGWLRAGITLIRAVIIPSLTYSGDVWVAANKATEKFIRDEYKNIIYNILEIPTNTKWTSVLADLNLPNIQCVIDKLKINYMNHTLWGKGDQKLREMLWEEHRLLPESSLINTVDQVCAIYKIPAVSRVTLDKALVKKQIKLMDEIDIWVSNVKSSATRNVGLERVRLSTNFHKLSKREAQALIAFNASAFKLKTAWGDFHKIQTCLAPLCSGLDGLEHIKVCPYYDVKWADKFEQDCLLLARWLVGVDKERRRRWRGECLF